MTFFIDTSSDKSQRIRIDASSEEEAVTLFHRVSEDEIADVQVIDEDSSELDDDA